MVNKKQKIWRDNFSIRQVHYQFVTPACIDMINYQPSIFKGILRELVWVQQDDNNIATYFPVDQLRAFIDYTIRIIQAKPELIDKMHRETAHRVADYFKCSAALLKINFKNLSTAELIKNYQKIIHHQMIHHGWAISTTWFVDSDNEDFSKLLLKKTEPLTSGSDYELADVFSALTTPIKPSPALKEELAAWRLVKVIVNNKEARAIFSQKNTAKIEAGINKLPRPLKNKILSHFRKWRWQPFTYIGPAYELDYYLALWSGWIREKIKPTRKIKELEGYTRRVQTEKSKIFKDLKINPVDRKLFQIASDIIYLKAYRKDAIFFGMYVLDKILREISVRLHLSIGQVRALAYWEVPAALRRGYFSADILNARRKFSVYYQKDEKGIIYTGSAAKKFLSRLRIEKKVVKKVSELAGTVACPGKAKGRVKIINLPEEMGKMKAGDIMVAHTTFPSLVPAMKKASAIITDDGGITCHAAIVSRELRTPCIVGTKIATQVLKDGDLVEVDANKGIVKVIKKG